MTKPPEAKSGAPEKRSEDAIFADLAELCCSPGYVHAIAYFDSRDNLIRFGDTLTAEDMASQHDAARLVRTEIATLIGLMVKQPVSDELPTSQTLESYIDRTQSLLEEMHWSMSSSWLDGFDPEKGLMGLADPFSEARNLREPIFYSGESAYGFQYRALAAAKYQRDTGWLEANKSFSIADATRVATALGELLADRQMEHIKAFRAMDPNQWTMLPASIFSAKEAAERSGVDVDVVNAVLAAFTLPEGERNEGFTALHDFNATNAAPILPWSENRFLLLQHYSLLEAIYESPFFWMLGDKAYKPQALANRGLFTETFAAERLEAVFGQARVYRNVILYRPDGNHHGEIDVLVLFGDRAIIVQAKSKKLTIEARKGNDLQLRDDFKKAVQDAYDQAHLCAVALLAGGYRVEEASGRAVQIGVGLRAILPVCVVSDHYPALAFQVRQFLQAQTTDQTKAPLILDVFALDVIAEMLATPLHFLHYLELRARFGEGFVASHELTLLGYHLARNLYGGPENTIINLGDDIASELDIAMLARREGIPGKTVPEGILTRYADTAFGRMVSAIEARAEPDTTELGLWLLQLDEQTAMSLSSALDRIVLQTSQDGRKHDITIGVGDPPSGLTVHCSYEPDAQASEGLIAHCELRKHSHRADTWFGVLIEPQTGNIRLGVRADFPWTPDAGLDELTRTMPGPASPKAVRDFLAGGVVRPKIGRNDPCPCRSGKKYKKCCLLR